MAGLITLGLAVAGALYLCWLMLQPFINVVLWAAVLAVVFFPLHRRIHERIGSPSGAAIVSTLLVVVLILLPVSFITVAVVRELAGAADNIQAGIQRLSTASTIPGLGWVIERTRDYVYIDPDAAQKFIAERAQAIAGTLAASTLVMVGGVAGSIVQMVLVVFTLFYMFRDSENIRQAIYDILPLKRIQMHDITTRTRDVIAATIYGVLVIALIQGSLGTLIFWILGLPSPLLWGVVMTLFGMIPVLGTGVVWLPAVIFLFLAGDTTKALVLLAWGALVVGTIDNVLRPMLIGSRTRLHELVVFFGVLGLVIGPVLAAITLALIEVVRQANRPPAETKQEETVIEAQAEIAPPK